jgi:multidrug resistance efflux pump
MWKLKSFPLALKSNPIELSEIDPTSYQSPDLSKSTIVGRLAVTGGSLVFGTLVLSVTVVAAQHRLNYFTVDNALVNGPTIVLRSPIDGTLATFVAQTGQAVEGGHVLAKVSPIAVTDTLRLKLQGEIDVLQTQRSQIQQTLVLMNVQRQGLDQQDAQFAVQQEQLNSQSQSLNQAKVSAATIGLGQYAVLIDSAITKARVAQVEYDRYAALAIAGGISQQKATQMKAAWESAEAEVVYAKSVQSGAAAAADSLQEEAPVPLPTVSNALQNQRLMLMQTIQDQTATLSQVTTAISAKQRELQVHQANIKVQSQATELKAPSSGMIFRTTSNRGEQVDRSTPLITMVDCNSRWIEAFIPAAQANRINRSRPVQVALTGQKTPPFSGRIESLNGINPDELKHQSQAVFPIVPANLNTQVPVRVVVKLKIKQDIPITQSMCGIGQSVKLTFSTQGA